MIAGVLVSVPATADGPPRQGGAAPGPWSAPAALSACAADRRRAGALPEREPDRPHRARERSCGAPDPRCPGGAGARVAVLGRGERPGRSTLPLSAAGAVIAPYGALEASAAPRGQIVIAGSRPSAPSQLLADPGHGHRPVRDPARGRGGIGAGIADARLPRRRGDRETPPRAPGGLNVQRERFFTQSFSAPVAASPGGTPSAATVALDFRTDTLAVWIQGSSLYARYLPTRGYPRAIQRLAAVAPGTQVSALLSDDGRGIVAWSETRGARVSVHLDISGPGVGFGAKRVLESFTAPDSRRPATPPLLLRLRSEGVMIAWTGASAGHWVLRSAPVQLGGLGQVDTFAPAGQDAMLQSLAAGPDGEALMLWDQSEGPRAASAIYAARGFQARPRRVAFGTPELVAGARHQQPGDRRDRPHRRRCGRRLARRARVHRVLDPGRRRRPPAAAPASGRSARQGADREG